MGEEIFGRSPLRRHSGGPVQMSLRQECRLARESESVLDEDCSGRAFISVQESLETAGREGRGKKKKKVQPCTSAFPNWPQLFLHAYRKEMIPFLVALKGVLNQEVCVAMVPSCLSSVPI